MVIANPAQAERCVTSDDENEVCIDRQRFAIIRMPKAKRIYLKNTLHQCNPKNNGFRYACMRVF